MDLQIGTFPVRRLSAGTPAGWSDGVLTIAPDAVRDLVLEDDRIRRVAIDLVAPGDDARIILMRDVIEPRIKIEGRGHVYPGVAGHPTDTVGAGVTFRYEGFAVMVCAEVLPQFVAR